MQISVFEKPYNVANAEWDFRLHEILSKAESDNCKALEEFELTADGGEKVEALYALRDTMVRSTIKKLDRLIHEIEDYGPGIAAEEY